MVAACGEGFTAVVMEKGDLWSFSKGAEGQLGLGTHADQLLLAWWAGLTKFLMVRLLSWSMLEEGTLPV